MNVTRSPIALLAVMAVLAAAGCGDKTVDNAQVESQINKQLSTPTAKATSKCPSDEPVKKGDTFNCDVTWSNGAGGKVVVTQQGGNRYTYTVKDGSVNVPGSVVDASLENAQVDCPSNIVVKLNSPVTCNVTGIQGQATAKVTFTFSSADGEIDESSVDVS
jgi:hypothetical protein